VDDNLETLRERPDHVSTTVVRFALLQLTALGLLVFALASAFAQSADHGLAADLEVVRGLAPGTGYRSDDRLTFPVLQTSERLLTLSHFAEFEALMAS